MARTHLHRLPTSSLAFLAPGLLHQLGNQLFAAQGSAQLLPDAETEHKARILAALARGGEALRLLRALLGDASTPQLPLGKALAPLLEAARVSLRERGHQLAVAPPVGTDPLVDAAAVLDWTAEALCLLADVVPTGVTGSFALASRAAADGAVVTIRFERAAGSLPFPLANVLVCEQVAQHAARRGGAGVTRHPSCRPVPSGLELAFPSAGQVTIQEA